MMGTFFLVGSLYPVGGLIFWHWVVLPSLRADAAAGEQEAIHCMAQINMKTFDHWVVMMGFVLLWMPFLIYAFATGCNYSAHAAH